VSFLRASLCWSLICLSRESLRPSTAIQSRILRHTAAQVFYHNTGIQTASLWCATECGDRDVRSWRKFEHTWDTFACCPAKSVLGQGNCGETPFVALYCFSGIRNQLGRCCRTPSMRNLVTAKCGEAQMLTLERGMMWRARFVSEVTLSLFVIYFDSILRGRGSGWLQDYPITDFVS